MGRLTLFKSRRARRRAFASNSTARSALLGLFGLLSWTPAAAAQHPYTLDRDQVEGSFINLNNVPVRPMVKTSLVGSEDRLYAVNTHDSTVECFLPGQAAPVQIIGVPWNPVAIDLWPNSGSPRLVVVCRGSNALVQIDATSGEIVEVLNLRRAGRALASPRNLAEPSDLLRIGRKAYISCTATDSIVEVDLASSALRVWSEVDYPALRIKSPLFLSYDGERDLVLVAPLTSGNRSLAGPVTNSLGETFAGVRDVSGWPMTLPDEDLIAIDPDSSLPIGAGVSIEGTSTGTILFAHGVHPITKDFWQLNTEALNKDPDLQSEPAVKGDFARNRVTRLPRNPSGSGWLAGQEIPLDGIDAGTESVYVGQPYALAFHDNGDVYIAGLLTRNIVVLDQTGNYSDHWELPPDAIPRGILIDEGMPNSDVYVYCWGTNEVLHYVHGSGGASLQTTHVLNHDPTPPLERLGRNLFYDGSLSADGNVSCATCHVDGRSDLVVWNLSNKPIEDKGPMFTQTLAGIERLAPFHWRGERPGLDAFNPAFVGLLGHTQPLNEAPGQEFDQFEAFVFSIQNPANPFAHRNRALESPAPTPGVVGLAKAEKGQEVFGDPNQPAMGSNSCLACHSAPMGTSNDLFMDVTTPSRPERAFFKTTPFNESYRKDMSTVAVRENSTSQRFLTAFLGSGFAHDGELPNLRAFIDGFAFGKLKKDNLTAFVHQWDQGLAPAVHFAFRLDQDSEASGEALVELSYLESQAAGAVLNTDPVDVVRRNCSIAVMGRILGGDGLRDARWFWDAQLGVYRCEDPAVADRTRQDFLVGARDDGESQVFVGLPTGMAERFAVDYDMDGLFNQDANEVDPYAVAAGSASGAPSFFSDPTVTFVTTRVLRLAWETAEPTTAVVEYWDDSDPLNPGPVLVKQLPTLSKVHSVVLNQLRSSTFEDAASGEFLLEDVVYAWRVIAKNTSNVTSDRQGQVQMADFVEDRALGTGLNKDLWEHHTIVDGVTLTLTPQGTSHVVHVEASALLKRGVDPLHVPLLPGVRAPAVNRALAFAVFSRSPGADWVQVSDFSAGTNPPTTSVKRDRVTLALVSTASVPDEVDLAAGGPYVLAPLTDSDGKTSFDLTVPGLQSGDELMLFTRAVTEIRSGIALTEYGQQPAGDFKWLTEDAALDGFLEFVFADSGEGPSTGIIVVP